MTNVIIQGGGGHAIVVADCLKDQGVTVAGYCALEASSMLGLPYMGRHVGELSGSFSFMIAIGDNATRRKEAQKLPLRFITTIHPSTIISSSVSVGHGSMILHRVTVQARTRIGSHVILNTSCQVDHDGLIEDFVHIGPGAILCGNVSVAEGSLLGAGCVVLPNVKIGKWAIVAAGSVVREDVPDFATIAGVPARVKKIGR